MPLFDPTCYILTQVRGGPCRSDGRAPPARHPASAGLRRGRRLKDFVDGNTARLPSARGGDRKVLPDGPASGQIRRLLEITQPEAPDSRLTDLRAQVRNQLILQWLYGLAVRRRKLLAVRNSDIKGMSQQVSIKRRPDARDDPRTRQRLVKTEEAGTSHGRPLPRRRALGVPRVGRDPGGPARPRRWSGRARADPRSLHAGLSGREQRSTRPALPSARSRARHSRTVPTLVAALAAVQPPSMRATRRARLYGLARAFYGRSSGFS